MRPVLAGGSHRYVRISPIQAGQGAPRARQQGSPVSSVCDRGKQASWGVWAEEKVMYVMLVRTLFRGEEEGVEEVFQDSLGFTKEFGKGEE